MDAAIITVGDELLAGDTANTNATWLARQLHDRGVVTKRILTVPDVESVIAEHVRSYADAFDAVIVTGGLGGTPDDVTIEAVAEAFDAGLVVDEMALADVEEKLAGYRERNPDVDIRVDPEAEATIPEGARPLINPVGLAPGCAIDGVYVLPGIPSEMEGMFETVADEFAGDVEKRFLYTREPEANLIDLLTEAGERFAVSVGCYPHRDQRYNRLKVSGPDPGELDRAVAWFEERIATIAESELDAIEARIGAGERSEE